MSTQQTVVLRDGSSVNAMMAQHVRITLPQLMQTHPMAFLDLVDFSLGRGELSGNDLQVLHGFGYVHHDEVPIVILKIVKNSWDEDNQAIVSPLMPETAKEEK